MNCISDLTKQSCMQFAFDKGVRVITYESVGPCITCPWSVYIACCN